MWRVKEPCDPEMTAAGMGLGVYNPGQMIHQHDGIKNINTGIVGIINRRYGVVSIFKIIEKISTTGSSIHSILCSG